jgi:XisI protein
MERVAQYRDTIHCLLADYVQLYATISDAGVDTDMIVDDAHGEYLLMRVGWCGVTRVRRSVFYLRLRNGKIWIEEDWTKEGVATELMSRGVPKEDIVLAFNPPELRDLTEFAVA